WLGNGDGTLRFGSTSATGACNAVTVGDFNNDGKFDFASADFSANTVSVFLGHGDGTFQSPRTYPVPTQPNTIVAVDLNDDGKLDLVTGDALDSRSPGIVSVLLGNGDGTFQPRTDLSADVGPFGLAIADLNRDGRPDIAS